jgi:hypothetical protein
LNFYHRGFNLTKILQTCTNGAKNCSEQRNKLHQKSSAFILAGTKALIAMKKKIILLLLPVFCLSVLCQSKKEKNAELMEAFIAMLNNPKKFEGSGIRFDGVYSIFDTSRDNNGVRSCDSHYVEFPFCFYKNGLASIGCCSGAEPYNSCGGTFNINKDTVDIICYSEFDTRAGQRKYFLSHFQGIIKNRDTILHCKLLPPYKHGRYVEHKFIPDSNFAFRDKQTEYMLVFKPYWPKRFVDSDNFWIDKYRQ